MSAILSSRFYLLLTACLLFLGACARPAGLAEDPKVQAADLVFTNGYVYTVNSNRQVASALAVANGKIVAIGDDVAMAPYIGSATEVRDLNGKMVMPGLYDAHIHALGIVEPDMCDLKSAALSLDDMVPVIKECIERYEIATGDWLVVLQWAFSQGNQPSAHYPNIRSALDAVSTEHPIFLWGDDGHHGAANSAALAKATTMDGDVVGLSKATISTVFSDYKELISVDVQGEPSGGLSEGIRLAVRPSFEQDMLGFNAPAENVMPRVAKKLAANGITSIQDAITTPETLEKYKWLEGSGEMTFRLRGALFNRPIKSNTEEGIALIPEYIKGFKALRDQYKDSKYIRAEAVKLFADAVLEGNPMSSPPTLPVAATLAGFKQPIFGIDEATQELDVSGYVDLDGDACKSVQANSEAYATQQDIAKYEAKYGYLPSQCKRAAGVLEHSEKFIHEFVRQVTEAGFHLHIHALADRGVRVATDAFEKVKDEADKAGLSQSFAHLQLVHPNEQRRIGELGIYTVFTYVWIRPDSEYDAIQT